MGGIRKNRSPQVYIFKYSSKIIKKLIIKFRDNLDPRFATPVVVNFKFSEKQKLRFLVVDVDNPGQGVKDQDIIGHKDIELAKLLRQPGSTMARKHLK